MVSERYVRLAEGGDDDDNITDDEWGIISSGFSESSKEGTADTEEKKVALGVDLRQVRGILVRGILVSMILHADSGAHSREPPLSFSVGPRRCVGRSLSRHYAIIARYWNLASCN